jgi:hypothetical protein
MIFFSPSFGLRPALAFPVALFPALEAQLLVLALFRHVAETMAPEALLHADLVRYEAEGQADDDLSSFHCLVVDSRFHGEDHVLPPLVLALPLGEEREALPELFQRLSSVQPVVLLVDVRHHLFGAPVRLQPCQGQCGVHPWDVPHRHSLPLAQFLLQLLLLFLALAGKDHRPVLTGAHLGYRAPDHFDVHLLEDILQPAPRICRDDGLVDFLHAGFQPLRVGHLLAPLGLRSIGRAPLRLRPPVLRPLGRCPLEAAPL